MPRPHYPREKSPRYTLDKRLGRSQNRSGRVGEEKNSEPLPGFGPPIIQPVAQRYATELSEAVESFDYTVRDTHDKTQDRYKIRNWMLLFNSESNYLFVLKML
jgi:hypothetical protein